MSLFFCVIFHVPNPYFENHKVWNINFEFVPYNCLIRFSWRYSYFPREDETVPKIYYPSKKEFFILQLMHRYMIILRYIVIINPNKRRILIWIYSFKFKHFNFFKGFYCTNSHFFIETIISQRRTTFGFR